MTRHLLNGSFAFVLSVLVVSGLPPIKAYAADNGQVTSAAASAQPDAIEMAALDAEHGLFVTSHDTATVGPHGIPNRKFVVARAPDPARFHDGWTYLKDADGKKDGIQVYKDKTYLSFEYFRHGRKIATANYRDGRPSGWFYQYAQTSGSKHGFQYYFDGSYASVELFNDGHKTFAGSYRGGIPSGWFYSYGIDDKKAGTQRYVDGDYWTFEQFTDGVKNGLTGSYRKDLKDGWFYLYENGSNISKAYFSAGKVTDSTNGDRVLSTLAGGIPAAWRLPADRTSADGSISGTTNTPRAGSTPGASGSGTPSSTVPAAGKSGSSSDSGLTTSVVREKR